jgi:peptidoglycan-N-acetylglucosamine deacetylase
VCHNFASVPASVPASVLASVRSALPSATQLGLLVAALALALGAFGPAAAAPSASGTPTDHGAKLGAKIDALGEVPPAASAEPAAPPPASSSSSPDDTDLGSETDAEPGAPAAGEGEPAPPRRSRREPPDSPPRTSEDPPPTLLGGADRVEGDEVDDVVSFTFDDGPDPHTTPIVLDALARHHIPATFFIVNRHIVGHRAAAGLPILARIVADGHMLGGHTANHARLRLLDAEGLQREVNDSVAILRLASGRPIELFRPPYGVLGTVAARRIRKLGLTDVRWSIDPKDFQGDDGDQLRQLVLADIARERGGIVLMHDTKRITAAAIERLLTDFERDNCRRLQRGAAPILPVSLHYFLRDDGVPRPIPPQVAARTEAYRSYMRDTCEARGGSKRSQARHRRSR